MFLQLGRVALGSEAVLGIPVEKLWCKAISMEALSSLHSHSPP